MRMRFEPIPTAGSNLTEHFVIYGIRLTYTDGNVCIAFLRDGQQVLALTMPAEDATQLAAGVTWLLQLASGTVITSSRPTSWT